MKLISVIIPVYQSAQYIRETLASVLGQTYGELEVLCIDDGSTDHSAAIIQEIARHDQRVRYHAHTKNMGRPAAGRNTGLKLAQGEFVAFIDHDDLWEPEKLARQLADLQEQAVDFTCTNIYLLNSKTGKRDLTAWSAVQGDPIQHFTRRLLRANFVPPASTLMKRAVFQRAGTFDTTLRGVDDLDMWIRISLVARCSVLNQPLGTWRYANTDSISANELLMLADEQALFAKILSTFSLSADERLAAEQRQKEIALLTANRQLLKKEYAAAGRAYQEQGAKQKAVLTRYAPWLLHTVYQTKRKLQKDFQPIALNFDSTDL